MYLKLSSREFVECPFSGDDFGKITPRTFQDFDPSRTTCHGGFLATAIERWCPTLEEQAQLAHKIYLCLLTYQIPYKSKRLELSGDIDCGKTSVFNMFSGLIPRSKIAIITKEGAFGFSMIRPDTELVFIDEWTKETAPADMIKMVFQGGPFPQSIKFSDPNMQEMNAGIFATCNYVPKYKKKDKDSVERRIDEIKCRKLEVQSAEAPKWIRENAMHCLTYLINLINSNLNVIDESELTYTLPVDVKSKTTLPKEPVDEETIQKIMNCVVEADDSVPLAGSPPKELEVFRVIEEDMQVESELELHESDSELELHESDLELERHESECVEQYDESVLDEPCITMNEFAERPMTNDKIDAESLIGFISTTDVDSDIEPPKKRARKLWLNSPQPESDAEIVQILLERLVQNVSSNDVDASTTSITTTSGMSTQNEH
ncbi:uncharacterized protein [Clytia hemisphaerica]|uniref:uncharacterized protein isoform X2 n=1 Tax=Clytia hemisphaerica TaxID=252671 RepID=UPI0034D5EE6D